MLTSVFLQVCGDARTFELNASTLVDGQKWVDGINAAVQVSGVLTFFPFFLRSRVDFSTMSKNK
jgi:hypothetical protein